MRRVLLVIMAVVVVANALPAHAASVQLSKKAYTRASNKGGFSIQLPNGWKANAKQTVETPQLTMLTFLNPAADKEKKVKKYQAYINIVATPATSAEDTLESLVALVKQEATKSGVRFTRERSVKIGGLDAVLLDAEVKTTLTTLQSRQMILLGYDRVGYIVTAHGLKSAWKKYEKVFDQSLRSFRSFRPTGALRDHSVTIKDFSFATATLTVQKGDRITFTNKDLDGHTVTSDTGAFDSGLIANNKTYVLNTASLAPGTYPYHCTPHAGMRGTIIVQ